MSAPATRAQTRKQAAQGPKRTESATYRYADIKRYAITPAVKELNEKADLVIDWKESKRGRAVHSLQFTFKQAEKNVVQQELDI